MESTVLVYVTGHGFGHAVRTAELLWELAPLMPGVRFAVRTTAPAHLFAGLPARVESAAIDAGVCETEGGLDVDVARTVHALAGLFAAREEIVAREADCCRRHRPALILADIPFFAGDIAAAAGVPCVGLANFTWDWIYEPFAAEDASIAAFLPPIRASYGRFDHILRLPFSQPVWPETAAIHHIPLIGRRSRREPEELLAGLGLDPRDGRTRVLAAMRGGLPPGVLEAAARQSPDCLFLDCATPGEAPAPNVMRVSAAGRIGFPDLLAVAGVAVSKLGYGTVADSIGARTRLLYPPRRRFRETERMESAAAEHLRMLAIPWRDFASGNWRDYIRSLASAPRIETDMAIDGARAGARMVADLLAGSQPARM